MSFNVSDKVVCLRGGDDPTNGRARTLLDHEKHRLVGFEPAANGVYVVDAILDHGSGDIGLALVGSTVILRINGKEAGWDYRQFRKLEEIQAENRAKAQQEATS